MSEVVVLGAGLGGTLVTYELLPQLRPGDRLTLIGQDSRYHFVPSNPWVAVGWRERGRYRGRSARRHAAQGRALPDAGRTARRSAGAPDRTERRRDSRLRLSGDRHRPGSRLRRDRGPRAERPHPVDLPYRSRRAGARRVRGVLQEPRPDRGRRGAGRIVLRPGLRIRLHPGHRTAQAADPRPRAR